MIKFSRSIRNDCIVNADSPPNVGLVPYHQNFPLDQARERERESPKQTKRAPLTHHSLRVNKAPYRLCPGLSWRVWCDVRGERTVPAARAKPGDQSAVLSHGREQAAVPHGGAQGAVQAYRAVGDGAGGWE
jgi:hypothetical protein